uniref:Trafficking protein, kinesin binding 2 n=1 Tax=Electrophorus electricus TaxID=8005 RepID=A0A4W4E3B6_ELEEL
MFEVKPMSVEKEETAVGTDDGQVCVRSAGMEDTVYLYEGPGWFPSTSPDLPSGISPLLAQETLHYMILSSERVDQMTKTYNDIDVVTHLLAERDRDLELAARIGQSLLQRNRLLQEHNDSLEEQLAQALDQVHQLQHDLVKKEDLLRMVASASEESETDSSCSTPLRNVSPAAASHVLGQLELLQSKLQHLEEENHTLRSEASRLKEETVTYEEKEQHLVSDCVKELRDSNSQMVTLAEELAHKNETVVRHQEEITLLLSQIVELQHRVKELALEKEELRIHLQASKDAQRQLTAELKDMADRNVECVEMLQETQEEVKDLRNKTSAHAGTRRHLTYGLYPRDSLAAEIEGTMRRELSVDEELAFQDQRSPYARVFQTVRSVRAAVGREVAPPIPGSGHCGTVMTALPFPSHTNRTQEPNTYQNLPDESQLGQPGSPTGRDLVSALHRLSLRRQNFLCEHQYFQAERDRKLQELAGAESECGGSGRSSSFSSLSEFSLTSSCFKSFLPEKLQIVKPMEGSLTLYHWQQLAKPHLATILDPHPGVVTKGFRTLPQDTVYRLSDVEEDEERREGGEDEEDEEEGGITFHVHSSSTPEETQERVFCMSLKDLPLPPSLRASPVALATAVSLATTASMAATSGTSLTSVPSGSAAVSGSQPAPSTVNPGKCQSSTFSTYTFTTCRILHPSDVTQVTPSSASSPSVREYTPSSLRSGPSTPLTACRLSLEDSFPPQRPAAAPGGLAKLLLEKGISAQRAPAPCKLPLPGPLLLRPCTPPNSPCPSPLPLESRSTCSDNFLASRPAELFLQDVYGVKLGRASRPDLPSPEPAPMEELANQDHTGSNLVRRLRKLGLDRNVVQGAEVPHCQESATFLATGRSLLDGLRRNQSLPAMIGRCRTSASSPSHPVLPTHPTSLALPSQSLGSQKPNPTRRHASLSSAPPLPHKH